MFETFINHIRKRRNFTGHVELNQATYFLFQAGETVKFQYKSRRSMVSQKH